MSCEVSRAVCKHDPPLYPSAPSSLLKPTSFPLYLHMTHSASLVFGQGFTIKGEEGAKIFLHPIH